MQEKLMTVKEVAEVLGVSDEAIKKHIRDLFPEIIKNGFTTYLNEYQITMIKSRMLPTTRVVGSKTKLEKALLIKQALILQQEMIADLEVENNQLKDTIKENQPKVEGYNTLLSADNALEMNNVAKAIGWGRNNLFKFLREKKILMENNLPYQTYCNSDYFRVREFTFTHDDGRIEVRNQTLVTQKGVDFILKVLNPSAPVNMLKGA